MNQYIAHTRLFNRSAWFFTAARVLFAFGTAITRVFFNLYLLASGFDSVLVGITASIVQVGGAVFAVPGMLILDRIGRKRAAVLGAAFSLLSWMAAILAPNRELILGFQLFSGLGDVLFGMAVVPLLAEL